MEKLDIKKIRDQLHLTQEELATAIGVTRNFVYLMESGKKPISKKTERLLESLLTQHGHVRAYHSAASPPGIVEEGNNGYDGTLAQQEPHQSTLLRRIDALETDVALLKKLILK